MSLYAPVVITGGSGFVGANLLRSIIKNVPPKKVHILLRKNSHTWRISDVLEKTSVHVVDLRDGMATERLMRRIRPKTIFHLATHGAYPREQHDEMEIIETNVISIFNLLQACLKYGFDAFVNTGSSSEYGLKSKPMRESDVLNPTTSYGASKAWATLYGQYLASSQKAPIVTLRPFSVFGSYEPEGRLIPNIILSLIRGYRPCLASPDIARDFIFINDMIDAYISAAKNPYSGTIFNIASGKQTTIKETFDLISDIMDINIKPTWDKRIGRTFDTNHWVADIGLAKKNLNWKPKTNLKNGLSKTVAWFKKNVYLYE